MSLVQFDRSAFPSSDVPGERKPHPDVLLLDVCFPKRPDLRFRPSWHSKPKSSTSKTSPLPRIHTGLPRVTGAPCCSAVPSAIHRTPRRPTGATSRPRRTVHRGEASAPRDLELFFADALSQSIPEDPRGNRGSESGCCSTRPRPPKRKKKPSNSVSTCIHGA